MRRDAPARAPLDVLDGRHEAVIAHVRDAAAALADDVVMVTTRSARHVGVLAGWQPDSLEHVQLGQDLQDAEDRGPADPEVSDLGIVDEIG